MLEPLIAAAKHVTLPDPPAPGEPGPFSLGDPERLRRVLTEGGFAHVEVARHGQLTRKPAER